MENTGEHTAAEIVHHVNISEPQISKFKKQIENKDIMVCMGNTRSGKSTFVNYIQGNDLESFEDTKRTYIKVKNSVRCGPLIRHGSVSCTRLPTVWEINEQCDTVIVDVPGFEDNRGVVHDIVNTLFFNQLKHARSVKFVLVSDINDIDSDNVQAFTKAVTKVQNIINDFNELKDSVSVVFTKDCKNYRKEDIAKLLKEKILNVPEMQVKKDLIYHIIKNVNQIGIFKMPLGEGLVTREEVDCNIENAIYNTHPVIINIANIEFTPSEKTHYTLLDIFQKYSSEMDFFAEIKKFVRRFDKYFNIDKYVFASTEEELGNTKTHLQFALPRVTTEKTKTFSNLAELENSLCSIAGTLSEDFEEKFNFLKFLDRWLLLDRSIKHTIITKYNNALSKLEDQINSLIKKIDEEVEDRTKETIRYILSEAASDRTKLLLMGTGLIPVATKTLATVGIKLPESFTFEIVKFSASGCGLAGAGAFGVAAGGYGVLYYKTIQLRKQLREEQGR